MKEYLDFRSHESFRNQSLLTCLLIDFDDMSLINLHYCIYNNSLLCQDNPNNCINQLTLLLSIYSPFRYQLIDIYFEEINNDV